MQLITYTSRLYSIHIHIPTTPMPKSRRREREGEHIKQEKLEKAWRKTLYLQLILTRTSTNYIVCKNICKCMGRRRGTS